MRELRFIIALSIVAIFNTSCNKKETGKEKVSDNIIHIEDSIHYSIPELARLCDELKLDIQKVNIGDCNLHVEIEGDGIPIVLINGGPGGTHHGFHPNFSKISKNHKIIYYDQRGTGLSDFKKGKGYSFEQAVNDLENLRVQLDIQKWVVCGFSYGGGLAQFYSAKYPENVLRMILISSLPLFESKNFVSEQEIHLSELEKKKKNELIKEFINGKLKMKSFLYNLDLNGDWKRQNYYKPSKKEMIRKALYEWINDKNFNSDMSASYALYDFKGIFKDCPIPTIIFEGKNDLTWGSKKANVFRLNHPNAKYVLFEHSAHAPHKDEPKKFFSELRKFTTTLQPSSMDQINEWKARILRKLELNNSK